MKQLPDALKDKTTIKDTLVKEAFKMWNAGDEQEFMVKLDDFMRMYYDIVVNHCIDKMPVGCESIKIILSSLADEDKKKLVDAGVAIELDDNKTLLVTPKRDEEGNFIPVYKDEAA